MVGHELVPEAVGVEEPSAEDADDAAPPLPVVRSGHGPRSKCTEDRSSLCPDGCTMRQYCPEDRGYYWRGELPAGLRSPGGHLTKSATWGFFVGRTQEEAADLVFTWLWEHGCR